MKLFNKCVYCFFLLVLGIVTHLSAVSPNEITYSGPRNYQSDYRPRNYQYENQYNRNVYIQRGYSTLPYNYYDYSDGYYGGYNYYTSPPPPTRSQAFPDDASQDALYYQLQHR